MSEEIKPITESQERPKPFFMAFGYKEPEALCDFTGIPEGEEFQKAYDSACDLYGNKSGSLGRFPSLEKAQESARNVPVLKWNNGEWAER